MQRAEAILRMVHFCDLEKWSANMSSFERMHSAYPLVPLSKVLKRVKEPINIDNDKTYKRITVRLYGQGVLKRDEPKGSEIGTKRQFVAHAGQLILSRIDARNGAFGIVPEELDGAVVTNDFWLFEVENALPQFLMFVLSSKRFQQYWQEKSSGTTNRQRVDEDDFLNSQIALPTLAQQQKLICRLNRMMECATRAKGEAEKQVEKAYAFFLTALDATRSANINDKNALLSVYHFQNLSRWDVWMSNSEYSSLSFKTVTLKRLVIGKPMYGANEKAVKEKSEVRYIRITDIQEDGSLGNEFVSAQKVDPKFFLKENDFLIARSGNTVGKTFLYSSSVGKAIFAGYLVKYTLNTELVFPRFLFYYTKSPIFKLWVESNQRVFGQPNINGQEYMSAPVILPSLDRQKEISSNMQKMLAIANDRFLEAEQIKAASIVQFEEAVFGEAPKNIYKEV